EPEEAQHPAEVGGAGSMLAADQLVVRHAAIRHRDRSPRAEPSARAEAQARAEHEGVEQIALESEMRRHCAVVEWTRQRRDEIDAAARSALEKTAARHFDHHVDFEGLQYSALVG